MMSSVVFMDKKLFLHIIDESQKLFNDHSFLERSRILPKFFTRNRKMSFMTIIVCLLNFMRKALSLEILNFHELIGCKGFSMSKQAFSKARQHIKPEAFKELLQLTTKSYLNSNQVKRLKGYRIFSIDGTELEIEPTKDNLEYFGYRGSSEKACRARCSVLCEVFDGILIDATLASITTSERQLAKEHINNFIQYANKKDLIIFDRGYPSKEFIKSFYDKDLKFLMRLQKSFNSQIDACPKSDFYIEMQHEKKSFNVRVIKFVLESGEEEILITNLSRKTFKMKDFKDLYFLRWSVETKYNTIKNSMQIEQFTGRTRISIEQDFYATMYLTNLVSIAKMESDKRIKKDIDRRNLNCEYKTNEKMLIGILKDKLILMLLCPNPHKRNQIFESIIENATRYKTQIRPNRHFERPKDAHHRRKIRRKSVL
jgi:hypothetical protein